MIMKNSKCKIQKYGIIILLSAVCCLPLVSSAFAAMDPMYIGVGARALGMGKAYVGVAEDGDAIFVNPAGLSNAQTLKLSSMQTSLLGDINYMLFGAIYPLGEGQAIGAGMVSASIDNIDLRVDETSSGGVTSYGNSVYFLSYGMDLKKAKIISLPEDTNNLSVGATLKYFSEGSSDIEESNGNGINLDLGILYSPNSFVTVGLTQQNALPGGSVTFNSGEKESLQSITKAGAKLAVMGSPKNALVASPFKLNVCGDVDLTLIGETKRPTTMHLGAEFWPVRNIALRAGIDQDPTADGAVSNITAGVGFRYEGFEFNYAYHTYSELEANTSHFFSICYVGEEKPKIGLVLNKPNDMEITSEKDIVVAGMLTEDTDGVCVKVNGKLVSVDNQGRFKTSIKADKTGVNSIKVIAEGGSERSEAVKRVIRVRSVADISKDYFAKSSIDLLTTAGIIKCFPDGSFKPNLAVTRAELIALLMEAKGEKAAPPQKDVFTDVPADHWAAGAIKTALDSKLLDKKMMKELKEGNFYPDEIATRAEGVAIMARFAGLFGPQATSGTITFSDLTPRDKKTRYILAAKEAGLLDYIKGSSFNGDQEFTRGEIAEILAKSNMGKDLVAKVFNIDQPTVAKKK